MFCHISENSTLLWLILIVKPTFSWEGIYNIIQPLLRRGKEDQPKVNQSERYMNCLCYQGVPFLPAPSRFPTPSQLIELAVICVFLASASQVSLLLHVQYLFNGYFFILYLNIELLKFLLCL